MPVIIDYQGDPDPTVDDAIDKALPSLDHVCFSYGAGPPKTCQHVYAGKTESDETQVASQLPAKLPDKAVIHSTKFIDYT